MFEIKRSIWVQETWTARYSWSSCDLESSHLDRIIMQWPCRSNEKSPSGVFFHTFSDTSITLQIIWRPRLVVFPRQVVASLVYDKMEISTEDPNTPLLRHVFSGGLGRCIKLQGKTWLEMRSQVASGSKKHARNMTHFLVRFVQVSHFPNLFEVFLDPNHLWVFMDESYSPPRPGLGRLIQHQQCLGSPK